MRRRLTPPRVRRGPRDPGLQGERTALAWNRTGLALLVNALLALRAGWSSGTAMLTGLAVALSAAAGAAALCGAWRRRRMFGDAASIAVPAALLAATTGVTLLACAAGVAVVVSSP